jgi:hypothetical protein
LARKGGTGVINWEFCPSLFERNTETKMRKRMNYSSFVFQNDLLSGDVSFVSPVIVVKELLKIDEPLQRFLTTSTSLYAASSLVST